MIVTAAVAAALATDVPVNPDADQARQWIIAELARPEYQAAQANWFDRLASAVWNWLTSLRVGGDGMNLPVTLVVVAVVVVAVITAFLIFGRPRRNQRSAVAGTLFGENDERDASALRAAADAAAAAGDWTLAIEELFRCVARGLAERTIVTTSPGTTARDFAAKAGRSFPALASRLASAASDFDAVRYLGSAGTKAGFTALATLERELRSARPIALEAVLTSTDGVRT